MPVVERFEAAFLAALGLAFAYLDAALACL